MNSIVYALFISMPFLLVSCTNNKESQNKDTVFSYREYIENTKLKEQIIALYEEKQYSEAIVLLNNYKCENQFCRIKYTYLAKCHYRLNQFTDYVDALCRLNRLGKDITDIDSIQVSTLPNKNKMMLADCLQPIKEEVPLNKLIDELNRMVRKDAFGRSKTHYRDRKIPENILKTIDSINIHKLDSIVDIHGWPSADNLNYTGHYSNKPRPQLLLIHATKEKNKEYLPLIISACERWKEDWTIAEIIVKNLMVRYRGGVCPISEIPELYMRENSELDIENSLLAISSINNAIEDIIPDSIELICDSQFIKAAEMIKDNISTQNSKSTLIQISPLELYESICSDLNPDNIYIKFN